MMDFEEYIRQGEPSRAERAQAWRTAIGLQDVDGLKPSAYLIDTAREHIEGDISLREVRQRIESYYENRRHSLLQNHRTSRRTGILHDSG